MRPVTSPNFSFGRQTPGTPHLRRARHAHDSHAALTSTVRRRVRLPRARARNRRKKALDKNFQDANEDNVDDASDAWAAASWARTAIAMKRVRATLQFEDEAQDAHSRMAKELSALAEVGFARMVRPHLPQPVVEDLYPR